MSASYLELEFRVSYSKKKKEERKVDSREMRAWTLSLVWLVYIVGKAK